MEKNITLTIDEIHAIREEHFMETKGLGFEEYKKRLDDEIAPALLLLHQKKTTAQNLSPKSWEDIEKVTPDELDLKMLDDIDKNPDCHEFISQDELLKELDLTL